MAAAVWQTPPIAAGRSGVAVGTRFTRVTVVGDATLRRQVDVSLPADAPVAEQIPLLLRLLSVPNSTTPVRWTLSTPELGSIARDRSLDDAGVLDGTRLYLTPAAEAAAAPFVDDVERAAAAVVDDTVPAFTDATRRSGIGILVAVVLVAGLAVALVAGPGTWTWVPAAAIGVFAVLIGRMIPETGGAVAALVTAPAGALVAVGAMDAAGVDIPGFGVAVIAGSGALGLVAAGGARRAPGWIAGGFTAAVLAAVALVCEEFDLQVDRTAGLVLLGAVIGVGLAGQLALGGAGLINLMVADEDGDRVPRDAVVGSIRRGQAIATGVVWACAVGAAIADGVLVLAPGSGTPAWIGRVVGAVGGLIFGLRARMFTRARQVLPMLVAAVATAVLLAVAAPSWWSLSHSVQTGLTLALLALLVAVIVGTGTASLAAVPRARLRRAMEILEVLAVLALIPLLVLLFSAIPAMQRWLG
ncbi:MAG TPA: type VII secretion integral membrane protein EccD [Nakamurella sp.]